MNFIPGAWIVQAPKALAECWKPLEPFVRTEDMPDGAQRYENNLYDVTVRRYTDDPVFGSRGGIVQIGISSADGTARHDWRDFQAIKNLFAGPESEAFELYPAESRLLDPSNYFTIWCFPTCRIKVGQNIRRVCGQLDSIAPQRGFEVLPE